jgi:hypothetical protein
MGNSPGPSPYLSAFISYGNPDIELARRLVRELDAHGVRCWFWDRDSTAGKRTQSEILEERRGADKVIILCSYQSLLQDGVLTELDDQIREDPEKLIPLSLDDVWLHPRYDVSVGKRDLKPFLVDRNYIEFGEGSTFEASLAKLLTVLEAPRSKDVAADHETTTTPDQNDLRRRVNAVASLLRVRGDAHDLTLVSQILDTLAGVLILKYGLLPDEAVDRPRPHLKLLQGLEARNGGPDAA